ncbi:MAG: TIGR03936 family radical SAM-associated protein [Oscillospiraceae bacterium]|nr:TIGR03936 family radical SAM-associated protein [Oscillospiraceae bacterium]
MTRILFSKSGGAKFISHLDTMRTFQRAFLRAGLDIGHTEGFNPHPFVSILLPLSVGFSSACEILEFRMPEGESMDAVPARLNAVLPEGLEVTECWEGGQKVKNLTWADYVLEFRREDGRAPTGDLLAELLGRETLEVRVLSKKDPSGFKTTDLIPQIRSFRTEEDGDRTTLYLRCRARDPGLNPRRITEALLSEYPDISPGTVLYHRAEVLDGEENPFR